MKIFLESPPIHSSRSPMHETHFASSAHCWIHNPKKVIPAALRTASAPPLKNTNACARLSLITMPDSGNWAIRPLAKIN